MENGFTEIENEKEIEAIMHKEYTQDDEREVFELLHRRTQIDKLWKIYREYMDMHIILNDELKRIMFHSMLGALFTQHGLCYKESGNSKSVRLHAFIIQDSGTGKSHTFKVIDDLLHKFGANCLITIDDTEATLTGTVFQDKDGMTVSKDGILSELDCLVWDEGSVLLKESPFSKRMTDHLQMAMDEPGKVSKGLRLGRLEYNTNTTIIAGSYIFEEFKETIMQKGFLQRMFVYSKEFTPEEEKHIRIGKNLLKNVRNVEKMKKLEGAMFKIIQKCIGAKKGKPLFFNVEDTYKFNVYLETIYEKYIDMQFNGEKQKVLKTFFNRTHILIDKIATQRAIINGHSEVLYEDMIYAAELIKWHITSIHLVFDNISMKRTMSPMDRNISVIKAIITKNHNRMAVDELIHALGDLNAAGKWDLRYTKSLAFINKLIETKHISVSKKTNGEEVLHV